MLHRIVLVLIVIAIFIGALESHGQFPTAGNASPAASPAGSLAASPVASPAASSALVATVSAQATQLAQAATAVAAAQATAAGLSTAAASNEMALATAQAQVAAAQATASAEATQAARARSAAVTRINPRPAHVSITVDAAGVLAGNPTALAAARQALRQVLVPYETSSCGVAVALTFGHAADIATGTQLAGAIDRLAATEFPALFRGAAFVTFASLDPTPGQVDLQLYSFAGCLVAGPG